MYQAGWARKNLGITPQGYAMQGYGMWHHRAHAEQSPLFARAFYLADGHGGQLFFCCLDLGYVTHAMRQGVCAGLQQALAEHFREEQLVLTCTHTHSGPGGCSHEALYNVVTPGFVPAHVEKIVAASCQALLQARAQAAPTELSLHTGALADTVEVAWNRSLAAYNRNPDVQPRREHETHLALDRQMQVLAFRRQGQLQALLSLFGVHATCVGNQQLKHDGDNKGYAALHAEQALRQQGLDAAVAVFAQATAGDVSPHYHGPGQGARRRAIRGDAEYRYARRNGELQSQHALSLCENPGRRIDGPLDAIFSYADFSRQQADARYAGGNTEARTSAPCHGVAFFTGTPVDGPGMPGFLGFAARRIARHLRQRRLAPAAQDRPYYQALYAAQGPKDVLLESERKQVLGQDLDKLMLPDFADPLVKELKRQARIGAIKDSALVPSVLPLQIIRLGDLALVCAPGEFTTTAGARLRSAVQDSMNAHGIAQVLLCTYCNEYMGYVTTYEEYQEQAYEGGHTIYGQWTLAAFQTRFAELAAELGKEAATRRHDRHTRPATPPAQELALRSAIAPPS